jgi:hypothetical protein
MEHDIQQDGGGLHLTQEPVRLSDGSGGNDLEARVGQISFIDEDRLAIVFDDEYLRPIRIQRSCLDVGAVAMCSCAIVIRSSSHKRPISLCAA